MVQIYLQFITPKTKIIKEIQMWSRFQTVISICFLLKNFCNISDNKLPTKMLLLQQAPHNFSLGEDDSCLNDCYYLLRTRFVCT